MFSFSQELDTIRIDSTKAIELKEIVVGTKSNKAGVYQVVIPKKVLENETLDKTIRRVNFITIDNSKNLYFKGKKINTVLFNDKPISIEEFNKLNIEDVRSLFVETNNFNQTTGEIETVIRINEKKKIQNNLKGSLDFSQGFFQEFNYYGISLSNKIENLSSRLLVSNIHNSTENSSKQNINSNVILSDKNRTLSQPYFSLQNIYDIDETSSIYMKNKYSIVDEEVNSKFSNQNNLDYNFKIKNYSLNLRYDKKLKNNFLIKLNFDFINFNHSVKSNLVNLNQVLTSNQKFDELTFSPLLQKKGNRYELINSFVLTNRRYDFNNTQNNSKINQNIFTYFINYSLKINNRNSLLIGSRYQFEKNNITHKKNHYFLPNLAYLIEIDSTLNMELNYKRKLQRPSINTISNSTYLDENGNEIINQGFLSPQIDNVLSLDVYKKFKKVSLNIGLNYNRSKDYIAGIYGFDNQSIIYTTSNIEEFEEKSIKTSLSFPLWKEAILNLNYSVSKVNFQQNNTQIDGSINSYDISISGPLFKKYLLAFNSYYINRFYEFNTFQKANPDFSFSLSRNYLKDKLNVNLEFRNILDQDSNRKLNFSENANYYYQDTKNQSRLLLISLTYNFGKEFRMSRKNIQNTNSDMKLK